MEITKATPMEEINCGFQFIIDLIQELEVGMEEYKKQITQKELHHLAEELDKLQDNFNEFVKTEIVYKGEIKR